MSAEIFRLSDYRNDCSAGGRVDREVEGDVDLATIDLATAVDAAIRDLCEILTCWGSGTARQRAEECELMLRTAFSGFVVGQSEFR